MFRKARDKARDKARHFGWFFTRTGCEVRHLKNEAQRAKATAAWHARMPTPRTSEIGAELTNIEVDICSQQHSPFFNKLPLEIRRLVYSYALAGKEFFFRVVDEAKEHWETEVGKESNPFELACHAGQGSLSMPLSCKLA